MIYNTFPYAERLCLPINSLYLSQVLPGTVMHGPLGYLADIKRAWVLEVSAFIFVLLFLLIFYLTSTRNTKGDYKEVELRGNNIDSNTKKRKMEKCKIKNFPWLNFFIQVLQVLFVLLLLGLATMALLRCLSIMQADKINFNTLTSDPEEISNNAAKKHSSANTLLVIAIVLYVAALYLIIKFCCEKEIYGRIKVLAGVATDFLEDDKSFPLITALLYILFFSYLAFWFFIMLCIYSSGPITTEPAMPFENRTIGPLTWVFSVIHLIQLIWNCSFALSFMRYLSIATYGRWYFDNKGADSGEPYCRKGFEEVIGY